MIDTLVRSLLRVPLLNSLQNGCSSPLTNVWDWYHFDGYDPAAILRRVFVYYVWDTANGRFVDLDQSAMYNAVTMRYNY